MIGNKIAVFDENSKIFDSYEDFAKNGTAGLEGKTLAFVNVEYRQYGVNIHQINIITVATLTIPADGTLDLINLVMASPSSEVLLPQQKPLVYKWIMEWVPKEAWHKTQRYVKSTIA